MKFKNVLLAFVAVCATNIATAQVRDVQRFEGGVSAGIMFPGINSKTFTGYPGQQLAVELRFNIGNKFDVGAQFSLYEFKQESSYSDAAYMKVISPSIIGDYNWRPSEFLNLFVGAGFGFASDVDGNADFESGFEAFPRVGLELYDKVRLSADYRINFAGSGYMGFTIGYVFGGRPK